MKVALLSLILCMIGCRIVINDPPTPNKPATPTTIGFVDDVSWICSQEEGNPALIWIECDFINKSNHVADICIDVVYKNAHAYVNAHKNTCSGVLFGNGSSINYAAFTKKEIDNLDIVCGKDLSRCVLSSQILGKQ
jgi:hypothetical protein